MTITSGQAEQLLNALVGAPVEDRARVLRETGEVGAALSSLIDFTTQLTMTDATRAADSTAIVVNLADRLGSQLDRARARRTRARALSYVGRFDEALGVAREGARLAEEAGLSIEAGRARLASMHALGELGRLDEAIRTGELAREAFLAAGESAMAARADINIGTAYQRQDDPSAAVECFDRARSQLNLNDDALVIGHLENNRGEALLALNRFTEAEQAFTAALTAFEQHGAAMTAAIAEGNLADLSVRQGRLHQALRHFEQARRQLERDHASAHLARLLAEQADALAVLGMPESALAQYRQALVGLDQSGLALEAARARYGMGQTLLRLRQWSDAETLLAAAAAAFDSLGHLTMRARADLARAQVAASQQRIPEARALALKSLAALHDRPTESAMARLVLAHLAAEEGQYDQARAELDIALSVASSFDLAPLLADVLFARGRVLRFAGLLDGAITDLNEATRQVERLRGSLQAERFRTALLGERTGLYEQLVGALLDRNEAGDVAAAFGIAEMAKSRSLLDRLRGTLNEVDSAERRPDDSEAALQNQADRARGELSAMYSRLGDDRSDRSRAHYEAWMADIRRKEAELDAIESRMASTGRASGLFAPTATVDDVQACLGQDAALIEFFVVDGALTAFVITAHDVSVCSGLIGVDELTQLASRIEFQMNRALRPGALSGERETRLLSDVQRELCIAHAALIEPLAAHFKNGDRLVIVPHGALHSMPFAALFDGANYLIQKHRITLAPSAGLFVHLHQRSVHREVSRGGMVVIGVSDKVAPNIALEATRLAECRGSRPCRLLLEAQATRAAVCEAIAPAGIVHFACHGRFSADTPMASGLKLADGWMTLRDISTLDMKAELVVLSGCQTGLNRVASGDELSGLQRSFLAAGIGSLLVSLWQIDDATTVEFMEEYYNHLLVPEDHREPSAALREAQQVMMTRHRHPALWSPFVLVGGDA